MARGGFGDEAWRLARAGDAGGLERAAALLLGDGDLEYEGRRARAFALGLAGRRDEALVELNEGWSEDWPPPAAYAVDVARVHLLAGDCWHALAALQLESRGRSHWAGAREVATECVRREPALWRRALVVAVAAERGLGRLAAAVEVLRARGARRRESRSAALPGASSGS